MNCCSHWRSWQFTSASVLSSHAISVIFIFHCVFLLWSINKLSFKSYVVVVCKIFFDHELILKSKMALCGRRRKANTDQNRKQIKFYLIFSCPLNAKKGRFLILWIVVGPVLVKCFKPKNSEQPLLPDAAMLNNLRDDNDNVFDDTSVGG